ncbi:MAG: universal stress protein [Actinomycetota bacterium]|nr:universal stress protein [Actinomycetota bacterium]
MTSLPQLVAPTQAVPFGRLVCAVDGTQDSLEAARQACRLAPGRPVTVVCAVDAFEELARPGDIPERSHQLRQRADDVVEHARSYLVRSGVTGEVALAVEEGLLLDVLAFVVGDGARTLVAVGAPGGDAPPRARPTGAPGPDGIAQHESVGTVVRELPCSVLVARRPHDAAGFPSSIAVGLDGSAPALRAHAVATLLASATEARLHCVVALGGKGVDVDALRTALPELPLASVDQRSPVRALVASGADLVVVGHRGLHGLRSLGSVSERVVARCPGSVLVVH